MFKIFFRITLFTIILVSCTKKDKPIIEINQIIIEFKDTIKINKEYYGKLSMFNTFDDTIPTNLIKGKSSNIYLNLFKSSKKIKDIKEYECDTFADGVLGKDKMNTLFFIKPKEKGKFVLAGIIDRSVYIKTEDTIKLRQIEMRYRFKKLIYVE